MTRGDAHKLVDQLFDLEERGTFDVTATESTNIPVTEVDEAPARVLPEGKRVVRTKSSGDRVYCLDEEKKTRQWITNPEVLKGLGFEIEDVVEVEDTELLRYNMGPALYRVENAEPKA